MKNQCLYRLFAISAICSMMGMLVAGDVESRENAHSDGRVIIPGNPRIAIAADRADALYRCGEETVFSVAVKGEDGALARSGTASWRLDNYGAKVVAEGSADLAKENPFAVRGQLSKQERRQSMNMDRRNFLKGTAWMGAAADGVQCP